MHTIFIRARCGGLAEWSYRGPSRKELLLCVETVVTQTLLARVGRHAAASNQSDLCDCRATTVAKSWRSDSETLRGGLSSEGDVAQEVFDCGKTSKLGFTEVSWSDGFDAEIDATEVSKNGREIQATGLIDLSVDA